MITCQTIILTMIRLCMVCPNNPERLAVCVREGVFSVSVYYKGDRVVIGYVKHRNYVTMIL